MPGLKSAPSEREDGGDRLRARERERGGQVEKPSRSRDLPRVWQVEREEGPGAPRPFDGDALPPKSADRSYNAGGQGKDATVRRKPRAIDSLMNSAAPAMSKDPNHDLDQSSEDYMHSTPKMYQSNSFNIAEGEHLDTGDDQDHRQGSMKIGTRTLNAAKFIFNREREGKSKSNQQKASKSANSKLSSGPAIASVKKFLQSSFTRPSPPVSVMSQSKTFDEGPSTKTLPFASPADLRQSGEHWAVFKKPAKDLVFNRSGRTVGNSLGIPSQHSPPEERVNSSRHDN